VGDGIHEQDDFARLGGKCLACIVALHTGLHNGHHLNDMAYPGNWAPCTGGAPAPTPAPHSHDSCGGDKIIHGTSDCLVIGGVLLVCTLILGIICGNMICGKKKPAAATQQQVQPAAFDLQQAQGQYVPQQPPPQVYTPPQIVATQGPMFCKGCGMKGPFPGTFCPGCGAQI
jgi:hypothetical protein